MSGAAAGGFERLDDEVRWTGHIVSAGVRRFRAPDGSIFERDIVHHPGAVGVVPVSDEGEVILVRQYRAVLDRWMLEIPAGVRDVPGEDPATTAARELAEEVGLAADTLELLTVFHNSPGFADEAVHVYGAHGLRPTVSDAQGVEEEHMEIVRLPLSEARRRVEAGEITDAKTVIGILLTSLG